MLSAAPSSRDKNILIVEDERIVAKELQRSLTTLGYRVPYTAASCDDALRLADTQRPDLVLVDIRIRGERDGIATAQELARRYRVPVIYLTAYADKHTVERAKHTEPYGYLLKPVKLEELRSAVEIAFHKHAVDETLRARERWVSTTLAALGDAVVSTDAQGRVNYANPAAEALLARGVDTLRETPFEAAVPLRDERSNVPVTPVTDCLRDRAVRHVDALLTRADGAERAISDSVSPLIDDRGELVGAVFVCHDVTDRRRMQREVEHNARLAALGTLAAGVAHDLSNPLSYVLANVSMSRDALREHRDDLVSNLADDLDAALSEALIGVNRVAAIVAELRTFSRPESGAAARIDLNRVVTSALRFVRSEVELRAVIVRDEGEAPPVIASESRLSQVVVNLVLNAAQASIRPRPADNPITVRTWTDGDGRACLSVSDRGRGIAAAHLPQIFEPFFSTRLDAGGTGLGLTLCHRIVSSLGGTLSVESAEGEGTTFIVRLPPAASDAPLRMSTVDEPVVVRARREVLVIDEEPLMRRLIARALQGEFLVTGARSVAEGLEFLRARRGWSLVLCDIGAAMASRVDLLDVLRDESPGLEHRVVFLTHGAASDRARAMLAAHAQRAIEKPFDARALVHEVRSLVAQIDRSAS